MEKTGNVITLARELVFLQKRKKEIDERIPSGTLVRARRGVPHFFLDNSGFHVKNETEIGLVLGSWILNDNSRMGKKFRKYIEEENEELNYPGKILLIILFGNKKLLTFAYFSLYGRPYTDDIICCDHYGGWIEIVR